MAQIHPREKILPKHQGATASRFGIARRSRSLAAGPNSAIYWVCRAQPGSTTVMGIANLAMLTGNLGREGGSKSGGQNNVQGSHMGSFP
jgi:formate dehydrogenase major subunit